jgi:hypothetical protein
MNIDRNGRLHEKGPAMPGRREFFVGGVGLAAASLLSQVPACAQAGSEQPTSPQQTEATPPATGSPNVKEEITRLSKEKWRWMSERKVDSLANLFHEEAVFVHMGATMSKKQELDVIRTDRIHYKTVDIQEASVRIIGTTAILLNRIRLVAVVGGDEVTNPFVVTEVYVRQEGAWKLASLSFTRTLG